MTCTNGPEILERTQLTVSVERLDAEGEIGEAKVYLDDEQRHGVPMTARQARVLAQALIEAADTAEGVA